MNKTQQCMHNNNDVPAAVRAHYDAQARETRSQRSECRVIALRRANNNCKSRIIASALLRAAQRIQQSVAGNVAANVEKERSIYVLDLGCGKGGDLAKYAESAAALGVSVVYCGLDMSPASIDAARKRYAENAARWPALSAVTFAVGDFCRVENRDVPSQWLAADIVSVQFALHYAFASFASARRFFDNVGRSLAHNGELIGTLVDSSVLLERLLQCSAPQNSNVIGVASPVAEFGNSVYRVQMAEAERQALPTVLKQTQHCGTAYTFWLDGCVEACQEYVVPRDLLAAMAYRAQLQLRVWLPLSAVSSEIRLSPDEQQVQDLYSAFVFARTAAAPSAV